MLLNADYFYIEIPIRNKMKLDLIVKNVRVVRPNKNSIDLLDLGIKDGKFVKIASEINYASQGLWMPICTRAFTHLWAKML
jgi:formylmethanofuran dehydrogenase subunit A